MSRRRVLWKRLVLGFVVVLLIGGIWLSLTVVSITKELPRPEKISDIKPTQSTKIYDRTGQVLLYEIHGEQNRTVVTSDQIPLYAKQATIAIEDQNFYTHKAFDVRAIIRALFVNLRSGTAAQGGSTITQQLAKNVFLSPEKTIKRKLKELVLAYWIEQRYTKDEILTLYLNQVSYGSNAYGIQSAAQIYFVKDVSSLSLAEAAVLASLVKAPSYYSPWGSHIEELMARKDYVLLQMQRLNFIDQEEYARATRESVVFAKPTLGSIKAPHFVMMVKEYLENRYGRELVEGGGLKVTTTLDWNLQEKAQTAVTQGAARNKELYKGENAAMVVQDPKTGQILTLVGSADYFDSAINGQFNVAAQGLRHPGSAFKPFAYLAAFIKGYTPDTVEFDVPTEFVPNNPNCPLIVDFNNTDKSCFHPHNFGDTFRGPVSLKQGLAQSINVPSVKTLYLAGLENTIKLAQTMGITTLEKPSEYGLSLVLGGGAVKLVDLVNAYSIFSQDGIKHTQTYILKIEDLSGNILEEYKDAALQVVEPYYTRLINNILSDVGLRAGLFQASLGLTTFEGYEVALKTGTTNDYRDAWVVGYTPFIVAGVWAGNSNYKPMEQQGGSILAAIPMWNAFMKEIIYNYPPEVFARAEFPSSQRPMLNGQYIIPLTVNDVTSSHIHTILYYLDKNNPTIEQSSDFNPASDPQFQNWEVPILEWAKKNIPNFFIEYNRTSPLLPTFFPSPPLF